MVHTYQQPQLKLNTDQGSTIISTGEVVVSDDVITRSTECGRKTSESDRAVSLIATWISFLNLYIYTVSFDCCSTCTTQDSGTTESDVRSDIPGLCGVDM